MNNNNSKNNFNKIDGDQNIRVFDINEMHINIHFDNPWT